MFIYFIYLKQQDLKDNLFLRCTHAGSDFGNLFLAMFLKKHLSVHYFTFLNEWCDVNCREGLEAERGGGCPVPL